MAKGIPHLIRLRMIDPVFVLQKVSWNSIHVHSWSSTLKHFHLALTFRNFSSRPPIAIYSSIIVMVVQFVNIRVLFNQIGKRSSVRQTPLKCNFSTQRSSMHGSTHLPPSLFSSLLHPSSSSCSIPRQNRTLWLPHTLRPLLDPQLSHLPILHTAFLHL
jgi:hypothetical protein